MALRPDRVTVNEDIGFFNNDTSSALNSSQAERGGIVSISTAGSGAAMDQSEAVVTYAATPSGAKVLGVLMNDVVNKDLTQTHLNFYKSEVQTGGKCTVLTQGTVVTNWIYPGQTPTVGAPAYVAHSGYLASTDVVAGWKPDSRAIGRFLSIKDENGYAKVAINVPAINNALS